MDWVVRHEWNTGAIEVEVIEAETNAANPFVRVEVDANVVAPPLPAHFNIGVGDTAVILRSWVNIEFDAGADQQWSDDLLRDADTNRAEVHHPVEFVGAGPAS